MKIFICRFIAVLGLVAAVRADEPKPEKPVLSLPGRVVVKTAVKVWDAKTGKLLRTLPAGDADSCLAFAPDGARLAVGGPRGVTV